MEGLFTLNSNSNTRRSCSYGDIERRSGGSDSGTLAVNHPREVTDAVGTGRRFGEPKPHFVAVGVSNSLSGVERSTLSNSTVSVQWHSRSMLIRVLQSLENVIIHRQKRRIPLRFPQCVHRNNSSDMFLCLTSPFYTLSGMQCPL